MYFSKKRNYLKYGKNIQTWVNVNYLVDAVKQLAILYNTATNTIQKFFLEIVMGLLSKTMEHPASLLYSIIRINTIHKFLSISQTRGSQLGSI